MNQYAPGSSGHQPGHSINQQPLAPISDLSAQHFQHASPPLQSHVLPPLHLQAQAAPNAHYGYATYKYNNSLPPTPHLASTPHTPTHLDGYRIPQLASRQSFNTSYSNGETDASYAPISNGYAAAPQDPTYTPPPQYHSRVVSAPAVQYPPSSFIDQRHANAAPYAYQQPAQHPLPIQPQPPQQQQYHQQSHESPTHVQEERPTPVVGSQGRRGILPSHVGPPAPGSSPDGSPRGSAIPNKNSDNKYPCHFCNKTYLHLKHLKRHHLRHTGERPYQCVLCAETFCRSDILKRHFIKCSVRRGNPTGATHLTHAQDHLKPSQATSATSSSSGTQAPTTKVSAPNIVASNPPSSYPSNWHLNTRQLGSTTDLTSPRIIGDSTRSSRSSSVMRPESSSDDDLKKRFSSSSTLATTAGQMEASPHVLQQSDRQAAYVAFNHDRQAVVQIHDMHQQHHHRDLSNDHIYHSAPETRMHVAPHSEQMPAGSYYQPGFPQYSMMSHQDQVHQQQWDNCFQPGAQDHLMYSGH